MANISAKIPEMTALHSDLTTKVGSIKDKTADIKTKLTAITTNFDTTATQALVEKYNSNIDPIMTKMADTVDNGMAQLNKIIKEYEATEQANMDKIGASADGFQQPNYQV